MFTCSQRKVQGHTNSLWVMCGQHIELAYSYKSLGNYIPYEYSSDTGDRTSPLYCNMRSNKCFKLLDDGAGITNR